jgi:hypothetical protein
VGGSWLRSGALSDKQVIALVNSRMVPVWVDVRHEPLPPLPAGGLPPGFELDEHRRFRAPLQEGFFLRSLVLSPDAQVLLNPQPDSREASKASLYEKGYFSYAQVKAADYLPMLEEAIARLSP